MSLLVIGFIFFQSLQAGEKSSKISGAVLKAVIRLVKPFEVRRMRRETKSAKEQDEMICETYYPFHQKLRKLAHMSEFAMLGFLIYYALPKMEAPYAFYQGVSTLFVVLVVAVIDEFIQLFIPGRSSLVSDVLIDFLGGTLGLILAIISSSIFH